MGKTYQPLIIRKAEEMLEVIKDELTPTEYAKNKLCDLLTEKFIKGELNEDDPIPFEEEEFYNFMNECMVYESLEHLREEGLIDSFDDENGKNAYFITEKGKKYVETIRKENPPKDE